MSERNMEQNKVAEEIKLFQQGIEQYRKGEQEKSISTAHFDNPDFNAAELTQKDKEIWDKIQDGSIDAEKFAEYRREVEFEEGSKIEDGRYSSRLDFFAFAANKATGVIAKKQLEITRKNHK